MTNVRYIVNAEGKRTSVILPIEDYEEISKSIIEIATLELFYPAVQLLKIPEKATDFIQYLICSCRKKGEDISVLIDGEFILTDKEIAFANNNLSTTTITTKRNEDLTEYMKSKNGKAIVDIIREETADRQPKGTSYKLNILHSINCGIKNSITNNTTSLKSLLAFTKLAKFFLLDELPKYNQPFRQFIEDIKQELLTLSDEPTIIKSQGNKARSQQNENSKLMLENR